MSPKTMKIITRTIAEGMPDQSLPVDEIHIWIASLNTNAFTGPCGCLNADERERMAKFRLDKPRQQFATTRTLLRQLLGRYLKCEPSDVAISHESTGKPIVRGYPLHFNVTHSDDIAAFAVSTGRVGIDIERIKPMPNFDSIVKRFFNAGEVAFFDDLPAHKRERAFFQMWTRKEALLKALGQGIHALESCAISEENGRPYVKSLFEDDRCRERWQLRDFHIENGFAASVVFENALVPNLQQ